MKKILLVTILFFQTSSFSSSIEQKMNAIFTYEFFAQCMYYVNNCDSHQQYLDSKRRLVFDLAKIKGEDLFEMVYKKNYDHDPSIRMQYNLLYKLFDKYYTADNLIKPRYLDLFFFLCETISEQAEFNLSQSMDSCFCTSSRFSLTPLAYAVYRNDSELVKLVAKYIPSYPNSYKVGIHITHPVKCLVNHLVVQSCGETTGFLNYLEQYVDAQSKFFDGIILSQEEKEKKIQELLLLTHSQADKYLGNQVKESLNILRVLSKKYDLKLDNYKDYLRRNLCTGEVTKKMVEVLRETQNTGSVFCANITCPRAGSLDAGCESELVSCKKCKSVWVCNNTKCFIHFFKQHNKIECLSKKKELEEKFGKSMAVGYQASRFRGISE